MMTVTMMSVTRIVGNNDDGNNDVGNNDDGNNDVGNNDVGNNDDGNNDVGNNDDGITVLCFFVDNPASEKYSSLLHT